jgi:hypothetical protein
MFSADEVSATVRKCYRASAALGGRSSETVTIIATLDATGEAREVRLAEQDEERAAADPAFRAFADSAERAMLDPE